MMFYSKEGELLGSFFADPVWSGDVWVLAGQSNMEGYAPLDGAEKPAALVTAFGLDDIWCEARDPLHRKWHATDPVHWPVDALQASLSSSVVDALRTHGLKPEEVSPRGARIGGCVRKVIGESGMRWMEFLQAFKPSLEDADEFESARIIGTGPGVSFGRFIAAETGVPVGLVPCAVGGTGMAQWDPTLMSARGESLYGSMMRRIEFVGGRVRGIVWYQGESDTAPDEAPHYELRLQEFVTALRKQLGQGDLPFLYVQIGRFVEPSENAETWTEIRELQASLEESIPRSRLATAVDLGMCDAIHIDADGACRLGERLGRLAMLEAYHDCDQKAGPRFTRARRSRDDANMLRLVFSGVNGKLVLPEEAPALCFIATDGETIEWSNLQLRDDRPNELLVTLREPAPSVLFVQYGPGLNPRTGIVDEDDMALPCFRIRAHVPAAFTTPSTIDE